MKRANTVRPYSWSVRKTKKQAEINSPPACVCVNQNIENIRTQIKDYVDDAGRARSQADEAQKEIRELQAKVHDLEEQLEARTVVKREPEDEVINANELLSQEIKNAIERPVHHNQPNNGNFVGTVNYRPEGGSR